MALVICLAISRSVYIFTQGRFWAEEGAIYFRVMYSIDNPFNAISYYYSNTGYFSLFTNIANYSATFASLEYAPLVTTYLSLLVVLAVPIAMFYLPINLGLDWSNFHRIIWLILCLALLIGPLAYPEVWVNTINAQVYFGILSYILLFFPVPKRMKTKSLTVMVPLLLSLSSPYSSAIGMGNTINAFYERSRYRILQATFALIGFLINVILLIWAVVDKSIDDDRSQVPNLLTLMKSFGHYSSTVLLGQEWGLGLLSNLKSPSLSSVAILLFFSGITVFFVWVTLKSVDTQTRLLMIFGLAVSYILVNIVGLGGSYAGRYSVTVIGVLTATFLIGIMHNISLPNTKTKSTGLILIVLLSVFTGGKDYWSFKDELLTCRGCVDWSINVGNFVGESAQLPIWPYPNWSMELP